jgi:hypothetical protein
MESYYHQSARQRKGYVTAEGLWQSFNEKGNCLMTENFLCAGKSPTKVGRFLGILLVETEATD